MKKYGFISQYKIHILFFVILFLSLALRIFKLNEVPAGLSWDEAAIGYNGFAIATQHRDEWLQKMPLQFKSFGEYKPPLAIYLNAITTTLFGLNAFAIRLPMALAGVATTAATFFAALQIFKRKDLSFLAMILVAFSPLNIQFSRIAFESSLGVAAVTTGFTLFLYAKDATRYKYLLYSSALISCILALYSNHTTKIVLPFILLYLVWSERKNLQKDWKLWLSGGVVLAICAVPLLLQVVHGSGTERLVMTSAFVDEHGRKSLLEIVPIFIVNFFAHFDPRFLVFGEIDNYRNGTGTYGILSFLEAILWIVGVISILVSSKDRKKYGWLVLFMAVGIVPAAIGNVIPHANRVHHIVPWAQLIAVFGYVKIESWLPKVQRKWLLSVAITICQLQLCWQLPQYYRVFATIAAPDFQYGYEQAVAAVTHYENQVSDVYFTDKYQQSYIYFLLYKKIPPIEYQHGALNKYHLGKIEWNSIKDKQETLIVAVPGEVPAEIAPTETIFYPTGEPAFLIYLR